MKKKLQDLTIKDPFLFAAVMSEEEQCRTLLEVILDKKILQVTVATEKTLNYHPDFHGVRLDVLAVEADTKRHYNVEMQVKDYKNIAYRSRYYHAQMDMEMLLKGQDYSELPDTYVIFICDYDPVGEHMYRYSFRSRCIETGEVLDDGTHTIWLSTKGENDNDVPEVLTAFLKYVGDPENARSDESDFVEEVKRRVKSVKQSRRWEDAYMQFQEMLADERAEGKAEGKVEGKVEGKAEDILMVIGQKGEIPSDVQSKIREQQDVDLLSQWLLKACTAKSATEFAEMIEQK